MRSVDVLAPAKLTLSLRITGVRVDGFHLVDAEMITLDLFDHLRIEPGAAGVRVLQSGELIDVGEGQGQGLVERALALAEVEAAVEVTKNIPPGAGLGGGSADAAAILRWAGFDDPVAASGLGADVAFCLVGGRARVSGIGEIVEPLPALGRVFTLVTPPVHCSTPAVYAMWDEMGGPHGPGANDLESAALRVAPELAATRDALAGATGRTPMLAGSGSPWFVEGASPGVGRVVHEIAAGDPHLVPRRRP